MPLVTPRHLMISMNKDVVIGSPGLYHMTAYVDVIITVTLSSVVYFSRKKRNSYFI